MIKATPIKVDASGSVIDWAGDVVGVDAVTQKVAIALVTRAGSDVTDRARGTTFADSIFSGRIYDVRSLQHAINFTTLKARRDVNRRGNIVQGLTGLPDLSQGGRPRVNLKIILPTITATATI